MKTFRILRTMALMLALCAFVVFPAAASTGASDTGTFLGLIGTVLGLGVVGLVVNEQVLAALKVNYLTIFNNARSSYVPQWTAGAMEVLSTAAQNSYAWMMDFPKMRKWVGDRHWKALKTMLMTIVNEPYEGSVNVPQASIEDDSYGVFNPLFVAQGIASEALWDDLFFALMNGGFTGLSYDGKAFFAANHASGSNKLSGGSSPLSITSVEAAVALLRGQKDSEGNPMFNGGEQIKLWVPPALEGTGRRIVKNDLIAVGGVVESNAWQGFAELKVAPKITSSTAWFLTVEFMGFKPFIIQKRKQVEFKAITDPNDYHVRNKGEFQYLMDARGNAGYGLHQLAVGSVGA